MKPKHWYAGSLVDSLLDFKAGDTVAIRRAIQHQPLLVGPVLILFRRKNPYSVRFAESMGVRSMILLFPNNVDPKPAPEALNQEIEEAYQNYLKVRPIAKRLPEAERRKTRFLSFE